MAVTVTAVGMAILMGKRNSVFVYFIAVIEIIALFLAMMGYLMLEGDPLLFGNNVVAVNVGFVVVSAILAVVLWVNVNFRLRDGAERI